MFLRRLIAPAAFALAATAAFGQITVTTSARQPFDAPLMSASHHKPSVSAFYYIWFTGQWGTLLDMVPQLGEYRSYNPAVIAQHMQWMKQAGLDNIVISWWGTNSTNGTTIDAEVPAILKAANQVGLKVMFMIDEYPGRTPQTVEGDVKYLMSKYSGSPAFYTSTRVSPAFNNASPKPVFFVYYSSRDTYPTPSGWPAVNDAIHASTGAVMLVHYDYDPAWVTTGHFDGMFGYGSEANPGERVLAQSLPRHAWYVPSPLPGFNADRSKGWLPITPRNDGSTYDLSWETEMDLGTDIPMFSITSFNEWSETTQIEPCGEGTDTDGFVFQDYGSLGPDGYLNKTADWVPVAHNYEFDDYSLKPSVYMEPGEPSTDKGLWQVSWGTVSQSETTVVGGKYAVTCPAGSYLLNYQAAQVYCSSGPVPYTIRADYFDSGTEFRLAVNSTPTATVHTYSPWVVPGNTGTWKTAVFTVPAAAFNGAFGGGSDFRFETTSGGSMAIGTVEVTKS